jgi:hypothetical protein
MRVKARAVILIDGRLIVAEQRRRGRTEQPILEEIARDLASGWRETPRWLGNLSRTARPALGTDFR